MYQKDIYSASVFKKHFADCTHPVLRAWNLGRIPLAAPKTACPRVLSLVLQESLWEALQPSPWAEVRTQPTK